MKCPLVSDPLFQYRKQLNGRRISHKQSVLKGNKRRAADLMLIVTFYLRSNVRTYYRSYAINFETKLAHSCKSNYFRRKRVYEWIALKRQ